MKTDRQLQRDVRDELASDPRLGRSEIGLAVQDGVVTLSGFVDSYAQKLAAEDAVERVVGVRAVAEALAVKLPSDFERSDTGLAHQVANALAWDIEVPKNAITAHVEHGWVSLAGDVDWPYQHAAAERATRYLIGVKGLSNMVRVKARVSPVADRPPVTP